MTESGPKICRASKRPCPIGGNHFSTKAEAQEAFEAQLESESKSTITSKKIGIFSQLKKTQYEGFYQPETKTLVLSDIDGTLLRGSLILDHAVMLSQRGIVDLGDWPEKWLSDPKNEEYISGLANSYRENVAGKKESELHIPEFIQSVIEDPEKLYSSLERLKRHQEAGHHVLLISGSPSFLVGPFAKTFGFETVASRYHRDRFRRLNGNITGMYGAPQKESVVEKMDLGQYDRIIGYGDTLSDVPLLSVADHSVLVEPNAETLHRMKDLQIHEILND